MSKHNSATKLKESESHSFNFATEADANEFMAHCETLGIYAETGSIYRGDIAETVTAHIPSFMEQKTYPELKTKAHQIRGKHVYPRAKSDTIRLFDFTSPKANMDGWRWKDEYKETAPIIDELEQLRYVTADGIYDMYVGMRHAGHFFSYEHPYVWVCLTNNTNPKGKVNARHSNRGFYVTITTIDDSALYADWNEPVSKETFSKVLEYFNTMVMDGLDTLSATLEDIESIVGVKCSDYHTS